MHLGRQVFGLSAIAFGVFALTWHQYNEWQQIRPLAAVPHPEVLLYLIAVVEILGGVAILFAKTARAGAAALGIVYLFFALLWLPLYAAKPHVYDFLANFFEQFSLVSGALIVYATFAPGDPTRRSKLVRIGYYGFGISVVSFTLEQLLYLHGTAKFVPPWIPPGQMFWAVTTTIAFALAAIALLTGRSALLASRLLVAMIAVFGFLVWLPAPFIEPHSLTAWAGNAENWAICGSAWIVADYLSSRR
ncbi:MAG TPA: DoxX family membrane protein [Candidatus Babeliales bacterium]|nr:DoxX family membrane protein [Candidatus Babeliales bacterium]